MNKKIFALSCISCVSFAVLAGCSDLTSASDEFYNTGDVIASSGSETNQQTDLPTPTSNSSEPDEIESSDSNTASPIDSIDSKDYVIANNISVMPNTVYNDNLMQSKIGRASCRERV